MFNYIQHDVVYTCIKQLQLHVNNLTKNLITLKTFKFYSVYLYMGCILYAIDNPYILHAPLS